MAKADWNISTTGSWAVTTDEYVSSGHSIKGVSGQSKFLYNGNLSLLDSRIVGQVKCTGNLQTGGSALVGGGFLARATSVVAPLNLYIVTLRGYTANQYYFSFVRYKAGVYTLLCNLPYILPVPGTGLTNWHQFRLSVTDEFSMSVLRLEYFNSPDWLWFMPMMMIV